MERLDDLVGVGPKISMLFHKLGIYSIQDLLFYYPKRYRIIQATDMKKVEDGSKVIVEGMVEFQPTLVRSFQRSNMYVFKISNKNNYYSVYLFNQSYLCKKLNIGTKVIVFGKYEKLRNKIFATEIRFGEIGNQVKIEPIYYTTTGLNRNLIYTNIQKILLNIDQISILDFIPDYLIDRYHFLDKKTALCNIHQPNNVLYYKKALQRLKYEELFLYLVRIHYLKIQDQNVGQAICRKIDSVKLEKLIDNLSFSLTSDQMMAVEEIKKDLTSFKRMNRLLQGDVGSGKTIVAFIAAYINYLAGYQTALMVPTEILACQHFESALDLFRKFDVKIELLISSISNHEKEKIYKKIRNGEVDFVIGTHSLIQDKVFFHNLGLVILDEQHRFGVNQRNMLKNKGKFVDVLSMSATPIPRTYALTIYGDMDISNIKTKPAGRKEVITYFKQENQLVEILELMKQQILLGHQIYVIASSIFDDETDELNNVEKLKKKMCLAFDKIAKIDMIHGKLSSEQKANVMKKFENGEIQILISTTVIEVGVNVPNASMIVIFQANLFGLSTLHQLRGRVGRGKVQSYCVLVAKEYYERLKLLENCNDGFEISEYDFKNRGEGDLFGIRQSGEVMLKLADLKKDFDLLLRVKEDVLEFLNRYLFLERYHYYLEELEKKTFLN